MKNFLDYQGLQTYDKEIKEYIKTNAGEKFYKRIFTTQDWQQMTYSANYYIEIPKDEHGMSKPYISDFYIEQDGVCKPAIVAMTMIYPATVKVKSKNPSNGFLIIKNKEN